MMSSKTLAYLTAMILNLSLQAMEPITLPNYQVLKNRLEKTGFQYFIQKTSLIKALANQEIYDHWEINIPVTKAITKYMQDVQRCDLGLCEDQARLEKRITNELLCALLEDQYNQYLKMNPNSQENPA